LSRFLYLVATFATIHGEIKFIYRGWSDAAVDKDMKLLWHSESVMK